MDSFYDIVTTETSAPDDGSVYSVLNCDYMDTSIKNSLSDEEDTESDPVYHILEVDEPQM